MLKNYVKIAFKVFLRRKFYTFISLFGISFTLVVLMVAAALFDHFAGPYPPETRTDRTLYVVEILATNQEGSQINSGSPSYAFLDRYVRGLPGAEGVSVFSKGGVSVSYDDVEKIESHVMLTDGSFWDVFAFDFLEGRPYTEQEAREGSFVAVINEATRRKFFGEESAVGKRIEVDGQNFRVSGVVANVPIFRQKTFADIWVPVSTSPSEAYRTYAPSEGYGSYTFRGNFQAAILAWHSGDIPLLKEAFQTRLAQVEFPDPRRYDRIQAAAYTPLEEISRQAYGEGFSTAAFTEVYVDDLLFTLIGSGLLFMLLPALHLINLNVSRIMERASEIGVRKTFGASWRSLVGQFVVENVLLTLMGGVVGFLLSFWVLFALSHSQLIQYGQFHLNYRIFLFGLLVTLFFGVFSGVYPAWKMSRLHPAEALRGGSL